MNSGNQIEVGTFKQKRPCSFFTALPYYVGSSEWESRFARPPCARLPCATGHASREDCRVGAPIPLLFDGTVYTPVQRRGSPAVSVSSYLRPVKHWSGHCASRQCGVVSLPRRPADVCDVGCGPASFSVLELWSFLWFASELGSSVDGSVVRGARAAVWRVAVGRRWPHACRWPGCAAAWKFSHVAAPRCKNQDTVLQELNCVIQL